eukprot:CAMPEP_0174742634 /NCGR_PEP_ID=MMETSP1094-20130205/79464_1 /TAXON_ID=156173 /ORGANISM="Chrysochromulina brevifilum, Strain UTEX LB 985" /LENGTH=49 /DNA_ID= /DNA_START= /DNA_END= /DNA_ORIENTATION=
MNLNAQKSDEGPSSANSSSRRSRTSDAANARRSERLSGVGRLLAIRQPR